MKKNQQDKQSSHRPGSLRPLSKGRFTRPVILSLILHGLLLIFLAINFRSFLPQSNASYPVTIAPLGSPGGGDVPTPPLAPPAPEKIAVPAETPKVDAPKADAPKADAQKSDKVELKKTEQEKVPLPAKDQKQDKGVAKKEGPEGLKKTDTAKKSVPPKDSSYSYKDVQAKIAKMSEEDQARPPEGKSPGGQPGQGPSSGQSGSGTGTGAEVNAYAGLVETKVKGEWVIPENLSKAHGNLEAIIVVIIDRAGKVQKSRFEKKSGNELYDQSAMRAIKKAEPFPPVPIELIDKEIGLIFKP